MKSINTYSAVRVDLLRLANDILALVSEAPDSVEWALNHVYGDAALPVENAMRVASAAKIMANMKQLPPLIYCAHCGGGFAPKTGVAICDKCNTPRDTCGRVFADCDCSHEKCAHCEA